MDDLKDRLRITARRSSDVYKAMAEAKSLRNSNGERSDLYAWPRPEETVEWRAADRIERLEARLRWFHARRFALQSKFDLHGPQDFADALRETLATIDKDLEDG